MSKPSLIELVAAATVGRLFDAFLREGPNAPEIQTVRNSVHHAQNQLRTQGQRLDVQQAVLDDILGRNTRRNPK